MRYDTASSVTGLSPGRLPEGRLLRSTGAKTCFLEPTPGRRDVATFPNQNLGIREKQLHTLPPHLIPDPNNRHVGAFGVGRFSHHLIKRLEGIVGR